MSRVCYKSGTLPQLTSSLAIAKLAHTLLPNGLCSFAIFLHTTSKIEFLAHLSHHGHPKKLTFHSNPLAPLPISTPNNPFLLHYHHYHTTSAPQCTPSYSASAATPAAAPTAAHHAAHRFCLPPPAVVAPGAAAALINHGRQPRGGISALFVQAFPH